MEKSAKISFLQKYQKKKQQLVILFSDNQNSIGANVKLKINMELNELCSTLIHEMYLRNITRRQTFFEKYEIIIRCSGGVGVKADCLKKNLGGMPSVGVFLRYPSSYLREFRRKPRKTPNG